MNEEIQVTMGLNTSGFRTELAKARAEANSFGSIFSGAAGFLGIGLGIGAVVGGLKAIASGAFDMGKRIRNSAEDIGVSTDFIQIYGKAARDAGLDSDAASMSLTKLSRKIGEAREGNAEATEAFRKWGIALENADGSAKSVEEITKEIATQMNATADATLRNAMAHDLLADKSGKVVGVLKNISEAERNRPLFMLSENDISALSLAGKKLGDLWETIKNIGAKVVSVPIKFFANNADLASQRADISSPGGDIDVTGTKEYAEALAKLQKVRAESVKNQETHEQRLNDIYALQWDLLKQINEAKDGTIEKLNLETQMAQSQIDAAKEKAEIEQKAAEDRRKSEEADRRFHEDVVNLQDKYNRLAREQQHEQFEEGQRGALYPTIQELANNRNPFMGIARQILLANQDQVRSRAFGFTGRAENDREFTNQRMDFLAAQGVINPEDYEKHKANQAQLDTADAVTKLLNTAQKEGIKIQPVMGQ